MTTKSTVLVTVTPPTVTEIGPVLASKGTVTLMVVAVLDSTSASAPLNFTILAEGVVLKFVPVMTTSSPIEPVVGVNEVMVGGGITKSMALVAVLPPTVTVIFPVVALEGTRQIMVVVVLEVTPAIRPLNLTALLLGFVLKFVPVMVTKLPGAPDVGVKLVMVGELAEPTVKLVALVTVVQFDVTEIVPSVVPVGTVTVKLVEVAAVIVAVLLLKNRTVLLAGTGLKFTPVITTLEPIGLTAGENDVMEGTSSVPGSNFITYASKLFLMDI